jgi:hypothetical protein
LVDFFLRLDPTQGLGAGEGAPNDVLEAGILAGQGAAGMDQALEVVGED